MTYVPDREDQAPMNQRTMAGANRRAPNPPYQRLRCPGTDLGPSHAFRRGNQ
jgi:hypothetical protein